MKFSLKTFADLTDKDLLAWIDETYGPELEDLKTAAPTVESTPADAPDGDTHHIESPSMRLWGEFHLEVDRTVMGVYVLRWLLAARYDMFASYQPPQQKLTPETFAALRAFFEAFLQQDGDLEDLITATVINDVGKSRRLSERLVAAIGKDLEHADHDEVVHRAALEGLVPCIASMSPGPRKTDLMKSLELGASINLAQWAQAENVPASLAAIQSMAVSPRALKLKVLEVILDVGGATGQVTPTRVSTLGQPEVEAFMTMFKALQRLHDGRLSPRTCYDDVLKLRSRLLADQGWDELSCDKDEERALLRLLLMGRVLETSLADAFGVAFRQLPPPARVTLTRALNVDGSVAVPAVVPYYMPGLFAVALRHVQGQANERRIAVLSGLLQFLARVYESTKPTADFGGALIERDVSLARDVVASQAFAATPSILDRLKV